jgi:hypothetical protein
MPPPGVQLQIEVQTPGTPVTPPLTPSGNNELDEYDEGLGDNYLDVSPSVASVSSQPLMSAPRSGADTLEEADETAGHSVWEVQYLQGRGGVLRGHIAQGLQRAGARDLPVLQDSGEDPMI